MTAPPAGIGYTRRMDAPKVALVTLIHPTGQYESVEGRAYVEDNGWLSVWTANGKRCAYPAHRVHEIEWAVREQPPGYADAATGVVAS